MSERLNVAACIEELIEGIDPVAPVVDREHAAERLTAYVRALGIESAPELRWLSDLPALPRARSARYYNWGRWPLFAIRLGPSCPRSVPERGSLG